LDLKEQDVPLAAEDGAVPLQEQEEGEETGDEEEEQQEKTTLKRAKVRPSVQTDCYPTSFACSIQGCIIWVFVRFQSVCAI